MGLAEYDRLVRFSSRTMIGPESADALTDIGNGKRELRKFNPPKQKPMKKKKDSAEEYKYTPEEQPVIDDPENADIISSNLVGWTDPAKPKPSSKTPKTSSQKFKDVFFDLIAEEHHAPVLDIDIPHKYFASTTEGHGHLYLDIAIPWSKYQKLLTVLAECGIIEDGYAKASIMRGYTAVRPPWREKVVNEAPHPAEIHKEEPKKAAKKAKKILPEPVPESSEPIPDWVPYDPAVNYVATNILGDYAVLHKNLENGVFVSGTLKTAELLSDYNVGSVKSAIKMGGGGGDTDWKIVHTPFPDVETTGPSKKVPTWVKYSPSDTVFQHAAGNFAVLHDDGSGTWYYLDSEGANEPLADFNIEKVQAVLDGTASKHVKDKWTVVKPKHPDAPKKKPQKQLDGGTITAKSITIGSISEATIDKITFDEYTSHAGLDYPIPTYKDFVFKYTTGGSFKDINPA